MFVIRGGLLLSNELIMICIGMSMTRMSLEERWRLPPRTVAPFAGWGGFTTTGSSASGAQGQQAGATAQQASQSNAPGSGIVSVPPDQQGAIGGQQVIQRPAAPLTAPQVQPSASATAPVPADQQGAIGGQPLFQHPVDTSNPTGIIQPSAGTSASQNVQMPPPSSMPPRFMSQSAR